MMNDENSAQPLSDSYFIIHISSFIISRRTTYRRRTSINGSYTSTLRFVDTSVGLFVDHTRLIIPPAARDCICRRPHKHPRCSEQQTGPSCSHYLRPTQRPNPSCII